MKPTTAFYAFVANRADTTAYLPSRVKHVFGVRRVWEDA